MELVKDPGDTPRTPAPFHTAVSCFFGEYPKQGIEPAVTKELWRGREDKKDKQYKGACSSTKKGGNKRYQMRKPRKR